VPFTSDAPRSMRRYIGTLRREVVPGFHSLTVIDFLRAPRDSLTRAPSRLRTPFLDIVRDVFICTDPHRRPPKSIRACPASKCLLEIALYLRNPVGGRSPSGTACST